jgi:hypothetical protein
MNQANMPVYSGKVLVKGTNGDELSVPYFGKQLVFHCHVAAVCC